MNNSALDLRDRKGRFVALEGETFDVLVIGAGITGAGIARDAAMRGLRVALVDGGDIAAGTSSRSSKLIHGGLRYLAQGHVSLVRDAATERTIVRRIAPHLAQVTRMLVPARSKAELLKFKAGMLTFEKLGQVVREERHEVWDRDRIGRDEPTLSLEGVAAAVVYPEYLTNDARLTLGNVRSALAAGAVVQTYARVSEITAEGGKARGAVVRNTLAGGDDGARVKARLVVNAAGPWVDEVRKLEARTAVNKLQLTKGIHVVFRREKLPVKHTVIMTTPDKRSIFVVPWGDFIYFGTTDTFHSQADYWPEITREDVDYLLGPAVETFKEGRFDYADIVSMWSGVRPLLAQKGKSPSEISRKNEILVGPAGVLSIAGGKLTSYRSMAARIVDKCEKILGHGPTKTMTDEEALPGGDFANGLAGIESKLRARGLSEAEAARGARLYGGEAESVYGKGLGAEAEAEYAVLMEGALTLEDYWVRRSARARFDAEGGVGSLEPAAGRMAGLLGWSDEERRREIEGCLQKREGEFSALRG